MSATTTATKRKRQQAAIDHALGRSAVYRLLSQSLSYPTDDGVASLLEADLPEAADAAGRLNSSVAAAVNALAEVADARDATELRHEHRRVLSHTIAADCPPCETFYTAPHIFQETQELSDIGGFLRAFGLQLAERERPDHITVELELMHFLTYKEAHAMAHHGIAQARICRDAQRKFMRDHLGRWAPEFAQRLARKSGDGFYAKVASLLGMFVPLECDRLRVNPELESVGQAWRLEPAEAGGCPLVGEDGSLPCI